ncbi:hypothetical protein [Streptomyces chartreusis]
MYCGHTVERFALRAEFTESAAQIVRDVHAGYRFVPAGADGVHHNVGVDADGCLRADGVALEDYAFSQPYRHPRARTWLMWWQFVLDDPFWFRRQRL